MRLLLFILIASIFAGCKSPSSKKETANDRDWTLQNFVKADEVNPILTPDSTTTFNCPIIGNVKWEAKDVFNPAAVVRNDTIFLLYRAEDKVGKFAGTSRIGMAWSTDGLHFTRLPVPVLYPDNDWTKKYEWEGGCEDPRVVEDENGTYFMTYTAYDGDNARLMVASSKDLYHWEKHGLAFVSGGGKLFANKIDADWSKSGSIVSTYKKGTPVATRINGKYWMYWGDTHIFLAESDDLKTWRIQVVLQSGSVSFLPPRPGKFDSDLVEPGPPAMVTDSGILLLYNSRNVHSKGDTALPEGTYAAGQALFDKNDPRKILHRMDTPFMKPDKPYEINGQVNNVCFIEGLVNYKGKWFLYYGTADSKIAVAVKQ
ncbi:MAG TPA: glycoside hydrolase family 130 protein [Chitinophagaceae bacterium]|nr:glycoside hydrolase family 130 protein [Chitinophagaceae bacterium]